MMQQTSSNKFYPKLNLILLTAKRNIGFTVLFCVIALLIAPTTLILNIQNCLNQHLIYNLNNELVGFALAAAVCAGFLLVALLYINFSFLYSKNAADIFGSMPLSRASVLFSRFTSAYLLSLCPLIVIYLSMALICLFPVATVDFGILAISFIFTAIMLLTCGAFTLIFIIGGGTAFDSIVSFLVYNIGVPLIVSITFSDFSNITGFPEDMYDSFGVTCYTSPFLYGVQRYIRFDNGNYSLPLITFGNFALIIAVTLILFIAANKLFKIRKAEFAGVSHAFKYVPFINTFIISFIGYRFFDLLFSSADTLSRIIISLIGAAIGAAAYNAISNRGFKKIKSAIIPFASALLTMLIIALCIEFDAFNIEKYIPKVSDISAATVEFESYSCETTPELSIALHKECMKENGDGENLRTVTICYTLNSGRRVYRRYFVAQDAFNAPTASTFYKTILPAAIKKEFADFTKSGCNSYTFELFSSRDVAAEQQTASFTLTGAETQKFVDAFAADLENGAPLYTSDDSLYSICINGHIDEIDELNAQLSSFYNPDYSGEKTKWRYFEIGKTNKNTLALMKELNFDARAAESLNNN